MEKNKNAIESLFNKSYTLNCDRGTRLLNNTQFFSTLWKDNRFQKYKKKLNHQKNRLNDYEICQWHNHTAKMNPAKEIFRVLHSDIKPEFLTTAWIKFFECISTYDIVPKFIKANQVYNTLHLCEAPGAFITSLNHFLKINYPDIKWNWKAITLNPYYEGNSSQSMIMNDTFIKYTLDNWDFLPDFTGNIMEWNNSQYIVDEMKNIGDVYLVTADGSVDCSLNPEQQENFVASLHFCETITALQILSPGGSFILKIFTIYECYTINLIYLLTLCFESINLFKPVSSKPGNSEVYAICTNFKGFINEISLEKIQEHYGTDNFLKRTIFPKDILKDEFLHDLLNASKFFYEHQYATINDNIESFENRIKNSHLFHIKRTQKTVANRFLSKYNLKPIDVSEFIVKKEKYSEKTFFNHNEKSQCHSGSFNTRVIINSSVEHKINRAHFELQLRTFVIAYPIKVCMNSLPEISLKYTIGKPIENLISSSFIDFHILKIYNELSEYFEYDNSFHQIINDDGNDCIIEFGFRHYEESYNHWEKSFLDTFRKAFMKNATFKNVILRNYNILLSQFGIGLLFLIASLGFDEIEFNELNSIKLIGLRNKNKIIDLLTDISFEQKCKENFNKDQSDSIGPTILGVIPLNILLCETIFETIYNVNTWRLYTFLKNWCEYHITI